MQGYHGQGSCLRQAAKPSPDKKPNYFFIPLKFAFSLKLNFPIIPLFAFISGRNALIFQNPSFVTDFFRNFAIKMANLLRLGKKRNKFLCFALDFS